MEQYFEIYAYNFRSTGKTLPEAITNYANDAIIEGHCPSYQGIVHHIIDNVEVYSWDLNKFINYEFI